MEIDCRRLAAIHRNRRQEEACDAGGARREPLHADARYLPHRAPARDEGRCRMRGVPDRPESERELKKAHRLAWTSIAYILSTIALLFFVMSGSQALKTEMTGEILSLIPPTLFLVGDRVSRKPPNSLYPFGHERAVSAGYVGAATALLLVGVYLFVDGGMKLAAREHPTIGGFPVFGHVIWTGWLGVAVLV